MSNKCWTLAQTLGPQKMGLKAYLGCLIISVVATLVSAQVAFRNLGKLAILLFLLRTLKVRMVQQGPAAAAAAAAPALL